jgi:hypothetical protein
MLGGTMADDEAAMRKGKGGALALMVLLGVALLGGLALVMSGGDEERVYGEIGKRVNGLKQASFDQFWGCALQGSNLRDINTNAELAFQIDVRALERGSAYALRLRDSCMDKLAEITPELDSLIVPDELKADVDAMKTATGKLRSALSGFVAYLDDAELHYDPDKARPMIQEITRGWYDFKKAHADANKKLKAKLE